ncbi:MAG: hypothetical protein EU548_09855 [Promethearchaeota archaeon]|nr:MAG: hypothetical protein EU548_09855 [Candidatus Lokiarchaeota archaeon]
MISTNDVGLILILALIIAYVLLAGFLLLQVLIKESNYTFTEVVTIIVILGLVILLNIPLIITFINF